MPQVAGSDQSDVHGMKFSGGEPDRSMQVRTAAQIAVTDERGRGSALIEETLLD
jgi:hypothetical protein